MDISKVKELIAALDSSGLCSLHYEGGDFKLSLSKAGGAAAPQAAVPAAASAVPAKAAPGEEDVRSGYVCVTAPLVGTLYRAREAGAAPIVSVGDSVEEQAPLCLIEAMKTFRDITAPCRGTVREICFSDGELAEFGAALMYIEPK